MKTLAPVEPKVNPFHAGVDLSFHELHIAKEKEEKKQAALVADNSKWQITNKINKNKNQKQHKIKIKNKKTTKKTNNNNE